MKRGVSIFNTDYSIRIDELARALGWRGFESLWLPEHTHLPKSQRSPWPGELNPPQGALTTPSRSSRPLPLSIRALRMP